MKRSFKLLASLVAMLAFAACNAAFTSALPREGISSRAEALTYKVTPQWMSKHQARADCSQVKGVPTCLALRVIKNGMAPLSGCSPSYSCGFTAQQLEAAYGITGEVENGSGTNIAVIEVGDYANAAADLAAYRTQYGLGTVKLTRYNEKGKKSGYPPECAYYNWCGEIALDMDMVSAACPKCNILVMEAKSGISDLEAAESEAVKLGATIISNSWVCYASANCGDTNFASYFNTPGIAYLASSGDAAFDNIGAPSVLDSVLAVGGTQLEISGSKYTETIWGDAGAGCADTDNLGGSSIAKPSWQKDPSCSDRTDADVSVEAGCAPGVAVYIASHGGWTEYCGTSASSPFTAGVIALKGNGSKIDGGQTFWELKRKALRKGINNITSGYDGACGGGYLCTAGSKQFSQYSGPGGWGTPKSDRDY